MKANRLSTLVLTIFILLLVVGSAFAQEAAAGAEAPATDIAPLVFIVGAAIIVGLGSYLAVNTKTGDDE